METIQNQILSNSHLSSTAGYHVPQCGMNSSKPRRTSLGKKVLFFTSVPFYWGLFFKGLLGIWNPIIFISVVAVSLVVSYFGNGWGLIDNLAH